MREKGVTKIALILLVLVCVFAIVACTDNDCKHTYTEKADAEYLKSAATCTERAVCYKSCSLCGEKSTETFEYGDVAHTYSDEWSYNDTYHWKAVICGCNIEPDYVKHALNDDGECTICKQQIVGTEGVVYVSHGCSYAEVTGYTGTEPNVKIAAFYNGLPVEIICERAFYDGTSLTSVTIGNSVTSIGYGAFSGCTSLKTVYYMGTAGQWAKISIGKDNSRLTNATLYYYSESKPTASGYWHYADGKPTVWEFDE